MTSEDKNYIKKAIREEAIPYFEDTDFEFYFNKNNGSRNDTIYEMLLVKAEDSSIKVSGLTTQDTSKYFKSLASKYKPNNSGILK